MQSALIIPNQKARKKDNLPSDDKEKPFIEIKEWPEENVF
jgi:hypothetical protein